jgi:hypothetical protein
MGKAKDSCIASGDATRSSCAAQEFPACVRVMLGRSVTDFLSALFDRLSARAHGQIREPAEERMSFRCNVCGGRNRDVPRKKVQDRETKSCSHCGSSLRMRCIVEALSSHLFGRSMAAVDFPRDKSIRGIGMSDWDGYAALLQKKFSYTNTFYHREPRLDITAIDERQAGTLDFIISSDVFEHIPLVHLQRAFSNSRRLLKMGGALILTVPYFEIARTVEHFPELYDFRVVEEAGRRVLYNRTADGRDQVFTELSFHGGDGMTLEMRIFNERGVLDRLQRAGFTSAICRAADDPSVGISWPKSYTHPNIAKG